MTQFDVEHRDETIHEPDLAHRVGREWLAERVSGRSALAVAGAWLVLSQLSYVLEPASNYEVPVIATLLEVVMWTLLATMTAGLVMQRRFGFAVSLGAAVVATAASIACPTTGHHSFGAWWFGQMACVLGLVAISVVALRSRAVSGVRQLDQ
jgi:hypothetical protein